MRGGRCAQQRAGDNGRTEEEIGQIAQIEHIPVKNIQYEDYVNTSVCNF